MRLSNFIGGSFAPPHSARYFDDVNPSTEEVIAEVPDSDASDIDDAVRAARSAFPGWSRTPAAERSRLLLKLADLIEKNFDELAQVESEDCGKPLSLARTLDIPRAIANFRFFATAILHQASEAHMTDGVAINYT
ncbi:MAG TPA: aldehyde dehydrogenase family protein, partial [Thermoanaerobaculia bacterium]